MMGLKILTVDDSKTIRMIVKKAFRPYDCQIFEGENGVEGLALASKESPDLIILDITMPVMNGAEMLAKMKEDPELKGIPVIMLTAEAGKDNVMKIVQMGVKDYMVKPFKGEQLIERVTKIMSLSEKKAEVHEEQQGSKYFNLDGDIQMLSVPAKILRPTIVEVETQLKPKLKEMSSGGIKKMILDLSKTKETNVSLIKLIITILDNCQMAGVKVLTVASAGLGKELKEFQETGNIPIHFSIDEAKAAF
jgi:two-component system cell cycle response regulator/two-component system chemotaxis response regulator CheY